MFESQRSWLTIFDVSLWAKLKWMPNKNIINTSQCFPFWSFGTSYISKYDSFFSEASHKHPSFLTCLYTTICLWGSDPKGLGQIRSAQFRRWRLKGGGRRRRETGGLFVRGVIFDTLMNSFKRFSKYGLMRAGRGCHLGFICEAFPWFLPYSRQPCLLCKWQWFIG